jgi:arsenate reductase
MTHHQPDLTPVQIIANPAVTIGRGLTYTYAGIAPASVPGFIAAQAIGLVAALGLIAVLYPAVPADDPVPAQLSDVAERQPQHA